MSECSLFLAKALFLLGFSVVLILTEIPAPTCTDEIRHEVCLLPDCRCSGLDIPGNLSATNIPQLVFLTFDGAVNSDNFAFYKDILGNRKNPNEHPITATFFVPHENTNYSMVNELFRSGHEIVLNSITHNANTSYWATLNESMWSDEITDQHYQMALFSRISLSEIKGMRAPFLQIGGDPMYSALKDGGFQWECSRPTFDLRKPGLWPYTNDYQSTQDCQIGPCPQNQYKGFWTVHVDATFNFLLRSFDDHYDYNRAPFVISTHANWLNGTVDEHVWERRIGFIRFLDYLETVEDVYIIGISRGLEWVRTPVSVADAITFPPFQVTEKPNLCNYTYDCWYPPELTPFPEGRWMHSCTYCSAVYPWLGNPLGS